MSSISLDVSGQRGLSSTINDPARTYASVPSKPGDSATIQLGSFDEIKAYLPKTAKFQLVRMPREDGGFDEFFRLVVPGNSLQLSCQAKDEENVGVWPHVAVSVRKWETDMDYYFSQKNAEVASENEVGELAALTLDAAVAPRSEILEAARRLLVALDTDPDVVEECREALSDVVSRA